MDNDRRNQEAPLVPKMVLFWLVIVIAAGILFIIGGRTFPTVGCLCLSRRRVLGIFILVAILIPVGDFFTVLAFGGYAAITALLIHGGTALYMIVIGGILLLKPPPTQDPR